MAHMVKVCRWKTGISAEGRSTRRMLHNTLQKWTEILEKHQLSKYDDLLFLYFCVTIFLSVPQLLPFSWRSHRSAHDRALQRAVLLERYRHTQAGFSEGVLLFTDRLAHLHPSSSASSPSGPLMSTAVPQVQDSDH